jgi:SAM-dependent methyltransferase
MPEIEGAGPRPSAAHSFLALVAVRSEDGPGTESTGPRTQRECPYYREDLALVHHRGFGFHADACAPGILRLLEPVRERKGQVVEIGCGSGLLTSYLVDAGHQVVATDASDAMLGLARVHVPEALDIRKLTLPEDPIPTAEAIVGVGHALNYLDGESQVEEALGAIAASLGPGGIMAIDLCGLEWGEARMNQPPKSGEGTTGH